ncbi:acylphosphatase [Synechococcus sp. LA31]|uniref:acylphosphatase n=1 Tax=Synechococcus sp. LA31 TaxID=2741953 RepID=UPI001BDD620C|nr:acylphosphatase [Synechococcus sp. LA31]QVV68881.1 acylphosphatase [Synechococcus sp. LA31]
MSQRKDAPAKRNTPRQVESRAPGWLIADATSPSRGSRAVRQREWLQVERPDPSQLQRIERWQLIVRGRVQGVGYRAACCQKARELDLNGWVRNQADGSVQVQAEGASHKLTELRLWCERGPQGAGVHSVSHSQLVPTREDWFEIRR